MKYIGKEAFLGNDLTQLTFTNETNYLGESSFGSNSLNEINFPLTVINIKRDAFRFQYISTDLDSVVVVKVSKIHDYSFEKSTHVSFK